MMGVMVEDWLHRNIPFDVPEQYFSKKELLNKKENNKVFLQKLKENYAGRLIKIKGIYQNRVNGILHKVRMHGVQDVFCPTTNSIEELKFTDTNLRKDLLLSLINHMDYDRQAYVYKSLSNAESIFFTFINRRGCEQIIANKEILERGKRKLISAFVELDKKGLLAPYKI